MTTVSPGWSVVISSAVIAACPLANTRLGPPSRSPIAASS
jgi:hypothetical protein